MDEHGPFGDKPLIFQTSTIMGGRALKNTKQLGPAKTLENQWIMKVSKFPFIKSEQIIFPLRNSGLLLKIRRTGNCIQRTIPTGRDHLCTLNQGFEQPSVRKSKSTKLWFMVVVGSPCDPWIIYQPDQPLCLVDWTSRVQPSNSLRTFNNSCLLSRSFRACTFLASIRMRWLKVSCRILKFTEKTSMFNQLMGVKMGRFPWNIT